MTQQEQDKIEQMLKSDNINDVNLAGLLIKQKLGLTDENLRLLYNFIELIFEQYSKKPFQYITRFELLRQLMNGDIHTPELEIPPTFQGFTQTPYIPPVTMPNYYYGTDPYIITATGTDFTKIPGDTAMSSDGQIILNNDPTTT